MLLQLQLVQLLEQDLLSNQVSSFLLHGPGMSSILLLIVTSYQCYGNMARFCGFAALPKKNSISCTLGLTQTGFADH